MASITAYGSNVANGTLTNACTMSNATGGTETSKVTTFSGGSGSYGEVTSQGKTVAAVSSIPTPTGNGWCYSPGAGTFATGNWSGSFNLAAGAGGVPADITLRFSKYSGGSYTTIGSITNSSLPLSGTTKGDVTFAATSMSSIVFGSSDLLYVDMWWHDPSGIGGENPTVYESTSATSGVADDAQITTSSFTASSTTVDKKFVSRLYQYATASKKWASRVFQYVTAQKKWTSRFSQYAVASKKFASRFSQYTTAQKKWMTRFGSALGSFRKFSTRLYQYAVADKKFPSRLFQYVTAQKKFVGRFRQYAVAQRTFGCRFNQFDAQSTSQMLWDDVHTQYWRVRASSTNSHLSQLSMAFFPPALVLSEHSVPGELDGLLIGQTSYQVLRSVKDVTDFMNAHP